MSYNIFLLQAEVKVFFQNTFYKIFIECLTFWRVIWRICPYPIPQVVCSYFRRIGDICLSVSVSLFDRHTTIKEHYTIIHSKIFYYFKITIIIIFLQKQRSQAILKTIWLNIKFPLTLSPSLYPLRPILHCFPKVISFNSLAR